MRLSTYIYATHAHAYNAAKDAGPIYTYLMKTLTSENMYEIEIYANTYITYLNKLVKINNILLRILQNQPLATP